MLLLYNCFDIMSSLDQLSVIHNHDVKTVIK